MKEEWKEIWGFPNYEISTEGRIKSTKRKDPLYLKFRKDKNGYLRVNLIDKDGKHVTTQVHRLVARNFLSDGSVPPVGIVVNHKNWNTGDNRLENLDLVSCQQNALARNPNLKTSPYPGVSWDTEKQIWTVNKFHCGRQEHLGYYKDEHVASNVFHNLNIEILDELVQLRSDARKIHVRIREILKHVSREFKG